jgi:20S proteasome alpha/beta subunit
MGLIVAVRGLDGIVMGTDHRGGFRPRIVPEIGPERLPRLLQLSSRCGVALTGHIGFARRVVDQARQQVPAGAAADEAAVKVGELARVAHGNWLASRDVSSRPDVHFLVAGHERGDQEGEEVACIYVLDADTYFQPRRCEDIALCGVTEYAEDLCRKHYSPAMTVDEQVTLVAYVIGETARHVAGVDKGAVLAILRAGGVFETLSEEQVKERGDRSRRGAGGAFLQFPPGEDEEQAGREDGAKPA